MIRFDASRAGKHAYECADTVAKVGLPAMKVLPSVWWNSRETFHFELLPADETIAVNKCRDRLSNFNATIQEKLSFFFDNS